MCFVWFSTFWLALFSCRFISDLIMKVFETSATTNFLSKFVWLTMMKLHFKKYKVL